MSNNTKEVKSWQDEVTRVAGGVRRRVLESVVNNNGGYLSQACSSAEILATLYVKTMNLGEVKEPINPKLFKGTPGAGNLDFSTGAEFNGPADGSMDRFFLSPSQYSIVLYAVLVEVGRMAPEGFNQFNVDGSSVEMIGASHSPGMELMSGSLGQTVSQAAGVAMARKLKGDTGRVYVFLGDGELQSGQTWEAMQCMAFYKLDNVIIYVDVNRHQVDGEVKDVMNIEPLEKRFEAFGARTFRVDGHNIEALAALGNLKPDGRPTVILADTDIFRGVELLRKRASKLHYIRFTDEKEHMDYKEYLDKMTAQIAENNRRK